MDLEGLNYDDPEFIEVFKACLTKGIEDGQKILSAREERIKQLRASIGIKYSTRKNLKGQLTELKDTILTLTNVNAKLEERTKEIIGVINLMKINADDHCKILAAENQPFEEILNEYKTTWDSYQAKYERLPMAKVRKAIDAQAERSRIEQMVVRHKIEEARKALKTQRRIQWIRTRAAIIEFAEMMVNRSRAERNLRKLTDEIDEREKQLKSVQMELTAKRRNKEEEAKTRKLSFLEMPPPKINLSHMRSIYSRKKTQADTHNPWQRNYNPSADDVSDLISINSVVLEQICMAEDDASSNAKENAATPSESASQAKQSQETEQFKARDVDAEERANRCSSLVQEKAMEVEGQMEAEPDPVPQSEAIEAKETQVQECNQEDENVSPPKKMKLSDEATDAVKQTVPTVKDQDESVRNQYKQQNRLPQIKKIETVHYNVTPVTKMNPLNVNTSSMFSAQFYDRGNSNISGPDFEMTKDGASMFNDSVCNFQMSECSNISPPLNMDEDAKMESVRNDADKAESKPNASDKSDNFNYSAFGNLTKQKSHHFSLF